MRMCGKVSELKPFALGSILGSKICASRPATSSSIALSSDCIISIGSLWQYRHQFAGLQLPGCFRRGSGSGLGSTSNIRGEFKFKKPLKTFKNHRSQRIFEVKRAKWLLQDGSVTMCYIGDFGPLFFASLWPFGTIGFLPHFNCCGTVPSHFNKINTQWNWKPMI